MAGPLRRERVEHRARLRPALDADLDVVDPARADRRDACDDAFQLVHRHVADSGTDRQVVALPAQGVDDRAEGRDRQAAQCAGAWLLQVDEVDAAVDRLQRLFDAAHADEQFHVDVPLVEIGELGAGGPVTSHRLDQPAPGFVLARFGRLVDRDLQIGHFAVHLLRRKHVQPTHQHRAFDHGRLRPVEAGKVGVRDFVHPRHVQHRPLRVDEPFVKPQLDMAQRVAQAEHP